MEILPKIDVRKQTQPMQNHIGWVMIRSIPVDVKRLLGGLFQIEVFRLLTGSYVDFRSILLCWVGLFWDRFAW